MALDINLMLLHVLSVMPVKMGEEHNRITETASPPPPPAVRPSRCQKCPSGAGLLQDIVVVVHEPEKQNGCLCR